MNFIGSLCLIVIGLVGLAMLGFRKYVKIAVMLVLFAFVTSAYLVWQTEMWGKTFSAIEVGDSEEKVSQLMGKPTFLSTTSGEIKMREDEFPAGGRVASCAKKYWYVAFFEPHVWAFCIDAKAKVTEEYELFSY